MKKRFKIFPITLLTFRAPMLVWKGYGRQRTPRHADAALQTSFVEQSNNYSRNFQPFVPYEDRRQKREVSFECFLLLSLSHSVVAALLLYRYNRRTSLNHLIRKNETFLIKKIYRYVVIVR